LVESATHPEKLASLEGKCWLRHKQFIEGKIQAMLMAANSAVIPQAHFGDFSFPSRLDEHLMARLGLDDRRLLLGGTYPGPFGLDVQAINLPGHMAKGMNLEKADSVQVTSEGLIIRAGSFLYSYSRLGLEKIDELAHG